MPTILYCTRCWTGQSFLKDWPAKCPACDRVVRWATASMLDSPSVKWELTPKDVRTLRALWISPERPLGMVTKKPEGVG